MRKILSVIFSLLLICSLAVSASAAEGFIYCEAQDLITEQLNEQHLALGELAQKTGVQMVYSHTGIASDSETTLSSISSTTSI